MGSLQRSTGPALFKGPTSRGGRGRRGEGKGGKGKERRMGREGHPRKSKQYKTQLNKTTQVQSLPTTLGQETRWAYSTTLPNPHGAGKVRGGRKEICRTNVKLLPTPLLKNNLTPALLFLAIPGRC